MKACDALIAWTPADSNRPNAGSVKIGPLLQVGDFDWTFPFEMTGGASYVETRTMTGDFALAMLFIEFNTLVVRDGIDPQAAHLAFLAIDEYRQGISPDMQGAEELP